MIHAGCKVTRVTNLLHGCRRPESTWKASPFSDSRGTDNWQKVKRKSVQPRQKQANLEHPAAIVLAIVDRVDNLPVAVKGDDHDACYAPEPSKYNKTCSVDENT